MELTQLTHCPRGRADHRSAVPPAGIKKGFPEEGALEWGLRGRVGVAGQARRGGAALGQWEWPEVPAAGGTVCEGPPARDLLGVTRKPGQTCDLDRPGYFFFCVVVAHSHSPDFLYRREVAEFTSVRNGGGLFSGSCLRLSCPGAWQTAARSRGAQGGTPLAQPPASCTRRLWGRGTDSAPTDG